MYKSLVMKGFYLCLGLLSYNSIAQSAITSVKIKNNALSAVVCFTLDGVLSPHVFALQHPERIVVDFGQAERLSAPRFSRLESGLITTMRVGRPVPKTLRWVFEVATPVSLQINSKNLSRNVVRRCLHLRTNVHKHNLVKTRKALVVSSNKDHPSMSSRDVIVVIDPGHGGKDPGARGPRFNVEKNIVLAIAKRLKQKIDHQPGMHAVLTRTGDYYVGLRQRLNIARKYNADIFVAIHADAFGNHESNGASVFALSPTGATSEAARWLAEKENYSELGGVNLAGLDDRNGLVRTVLIDLSQTATIGASLQMGSRVLQRLDKITRLHNNRVEQARFVVLKSPDIPSVLIETGFISNPREELNLANPSYQEKLTTAIFEGLKGYFWEHPPHGTRVEIMSNLNRRIARATAWLPMSIKTDV